MRVLIQWIVIEHTRMLACMHAMSTRLFQRDTYKGIAQGKDNKNSINGTG